jgi:hypothetical protein
MKTLVVHVGGIGDFILALPAIAALAAEGPLEVAGIGPRVGLAEAGRIARRAHDIEAMGFYTLFSTPDARIRRVLAEVHRAYVFMWDDGVLTRGLRGLGIAEVQCFPGVPQADWPHHASAWYAQCLGVSPPPDFRLHLPPAAEIAPDLILHPGSGSKTKNWPFEHFVAVAEHFLRRGHRVGWVSGPAEESLPPPPQGVVHLPPMSLVELGGMLARARAYLGNDSGISHLAAAVGCPAAVIFGPTNPTIWAPIGARVLQGAPWPPVEAACRTLEAFLP